MVGRIYRMVAVFAIIGAVAYGFGKLANFGTLFGMFGGMLLGWSLQARSGFAAWVLVSLKRPIRPGDRVQFPSLGLTGDVKEIGPMYTMLDQVGGTVGSEEAVGRFILVPNAMLFSQVVINYTVTQEAAYMLDEQIIRITFDSDWEVAERILLDAATEVTRDIIKATNVAPYIRSDFTIMGLLAPALPDGREGTDPDRLRDHQADLQGDPADAQGGPGDPYVYSTAREWSARSLRMPAKTGTQAGAGDRDRTDQSGAARGRPVRRGAGGAQHRHSGPAATDRGGEDARRKSYDLLAGDIRLEACKRLGWQQISAVVLDKRPEETN